MSDDVLVRVDNVSKRFCRSLKKSLWYGLQDMGSELGGRRHGGGSGLPQCSADVELRKDEFWAVKDVSFELRRGECLGLIGRNGAGKTTLLRMLNGLIKPDTGSIQTRGETRALIALGAGFNPILTGRENIFLATSVLGISKTKTMELLERIVEFSELERFIDTPFQSYSSGMQVRLGFASAIFMDPDVLILDEVLAVGDQRFRMKCMDVMRQKLPKMATIFVSHGASDIASICASVLPMKEGVAPIGVTSTEEGLLYYARESNGTRSAYHFNNARFDRASIQVDILNDPKGESLLSGSCKLINLLEGDADPHLFKVNTGFAFSIQWHLVGGHFKDEALSSRIVFQAVDGSHPLQATCDLSSGLKINDPLTPVEICVGPVNLNRGRYDLIASLFSGQTCLISFVGHVSFEVTGRHHGDLSHVLCDSRQTSYQQDHYRDQCLQATSVATSLSKEGG
ncbi:ABC transporter ATP-binding protein [Synechococcus sp. CBW1107]|uniref:ABC transporter ATP-binding protein n=1 Tax=Synechococcus sp. CBW1107 TaxID=2789857 RepID=UPI002AD5AC6D|nr:ABC transporter ATP-binding protein [Synechococcus sp. CBW1107]CAK6697100.1 hypothetical protein IFHNHDMJ_02159 [Synechococcus sp. CBW1107]